MPSIITRGAASAKAFGWTRISLGANNFITYVSFPFATNQVSFYSLAYDTVNNLVIVSGFATPGGVVNAAIYKFTNTGVLNTQKYSYSSDHSLYQGTSRSLLIDSSVTPNNYLYGTYYNGGTGHNNGAIAVFNNSGVFSSGKYTSPPGTSDIVLPITLAKNSGNFYLISAYYQAFCGPCCTTSFYVWPQVTTYNSSYNIISDYYINNPPATSTLPLQLSFDSSNVAWGFSNQNSYLFKYTNPSGGTGLSARSYSISGANLSLQGTACYGNYIYGCGSDLNVSNTIVVTKLDTSFTSQWTTYVAISGGLPQNSSNIAVDSSGNVYSACNDSGVGGITIIKVNAVGTLQWARAFKFTSYTGGVSPTISIEDIGVDNLGNFYICGYMNVSIGGSNYAYGFVCSFPVDGSKTGTYVDNASTFTYTTISATSSSKTMTFGSSNTLSTSNGFNHGSMSASATTATATNNLVNF
jgi:hypothetical protein